MAKDKGATRYKPQELAILFHYVDKFKPFGANHWEEVAASYNARALKKGHGERKTKNLKDKFGSLCKVKKPTGDPTCPADVKRAKRLMREIQGLNAIGNTEEDSDGDGEDADDDDDGGDDGIGTGSDDDDDNFDISSSEDDDDDDDDDDDNDDDDDDDDNDDDVVEVQDAPVSAAIASPVSQLASSAGSLAVPSPYTTTPSTTSSSSTTTTISPPTTIPSPTTTSAGKKRARPAQPTTTTSFPSSAPSSSSPAVPSTRPSSSASALSAPSSSASGNAAAVASSLSAALAKSPVKKRAKGAAGAPDTAATASATPATAVGQRRLVSALASVAESLVDSSSAPAEDAVSPQQLTQLAFTFHPSDPFSLPSSSSSHPGYNSIPTPSLAASFIAPPPMALQ
ncbi:unnamed protein product [Tilletia controversa]|uniref:DUF6818 domain-containing protein n=5 Tax=Tilletia TaxID=13289 RepID=A0ABN7IMP7_9BASI|nr:unnamed protein product [Tilletia controversa]CAD6907697.1 unnamed protein product [Tilletia caries]CAD6972831.1 unnamed protein product [Tilletia controversa]CAD7067076.1 unnamed protein product [Tilletia caries]